MDCAFDDVAFDAVAFDVCVTPPTPEPTLEPRRYLVGRAYSIYPRIDIAGEQIRREDEEILIL